MLSAYKIIQKKRDKLELNREEIIWFIQGLTKNEIPDYQMTALLMAIYLNGMTTEETKYFTDAMLYSGKTMDFTKLNAIDKHSTGGIGDKTSFILAPIARACGVYVPMIAGRGLGHTGGTVDKIEAIKGFTTSLTLKQFEKQLKKEGLVLIGQTGEIAPADKKIYALRDVTATVESIPLITASIMSKKLAEGAKGIVMDVKTGSGAFMSTFDKAIALSNSLRDTAHRYDRHYMGIISDMSVPLGQTVGNSLEIIESIETLKGHGPEDLTHLSVKLASGMIYLAGQAKTLALAEKKAYQSIKDGTALFEFRKLIKNQKGDVKVIDDYRQLPTAEKTTEILAPQSGHIHEMQNKEIGMINVALGGGRQKLSDPINFGVGITVLKKTGDLVKKGDVVAILHHDKKQQKLIPELQNKYANEIITIKKAKSKRPELIQHQEIKLSRK